MRLRELVATLRTRSKLYWLFAIVSIASGIYLSNWLGSHGVWVDLRNRVYLTLQSLAPHPLRPKRTVLVLVGDEEYWKGRLLAHRTPTNRDYLGVLVEALDACDPAIIALDFDMRSPVPDGTLRDSPAYADETDRFLKILRSVATRRTVVLAATINLNSKGRYVLESAVYDNAKIENLRTGYIQLPFDTRLVPTALNLAGGGRIDSFAEAIVRAVSEDSLDEIEESSSLRFGTFMGEDRFARVTATAILNANGGVLCKSIRHKIAIVGAAWHRDAYKRGPHSDEHLSPIGPMRGVFLHANYVEALFDSRIYQPIGEEHGLLLELLFSITVALILGLKTNFRYRLWSVGVLCFLVMLISYLFWQNLGIFFDFFFPVIFLVFHALLDYALEIREEIQELRDKLRACQDLLLKGG